MIRKPNLDLVTQTYDKVYIHFGFPLILTVVNFFFDFLGFLFFSLIEPRSKAAIILSALAILCTTSIQRLRGLFY